MALNLKRRCLSVSRSFLFSIGYLPFFFLGITQTALRCADSVHRKSMQQLQQQSGGVVAGSPQEAQHRRDTNVVIYLKRRLAMCYRFVFSLRVLAVSRTIPNTLVNSISFPQTSGQAKRSGEIDARSHQRLSAKRLQYPRKSHRSAA